MRIRTIKPEFWTHPVMSRQSDMAQLLALALLNYADDEGYFFSDELLIRGALFPRKDSTIIRRALDELSRTGYLEPELHHPTHGPIGKIAHFTDHQKIDRPRRSEIKELASKCVAINGLTDSTNDRRMIDDDSLLERKGKEGKGKDNSTPLPPEGEVECGFDRFWKAYPSRPGGKGGKKAAEKIWKRQKLEPRTDEIIASVAAFASTDQWKRDGGQYIPMVQTFLNQGRFDDDSITKPTAPHPSTPPEPPGWTHALRKVCARYGPEQQSSAEEWITRGWHAVPAFLHDEIRSELKA